jgi:DNA-binding MarR family transcriptional regulator
VSPLERGESPGFLLWHVTLRWQRAIAAALAPLELTHVQCVLLACAWWLNRRGETPTQIALAAQGGTDVKMTSQVVRALEAKGLLERAADPADARARRIRVTTSGKRLAPRAIRAVEAVDAAFFAPVETADALGLLRRLRDEREVAPATGAPHPLTGPVHGAAPRP